MGLWLADDLMSVDRARTPWLILSIHRPLVMTQETPNEVRMSAGVYALLEPLLERAAVDIVLGGHVHSFQRTCPMSGYACAARGERGTVHYTNGAAGYRCGVTRRPALSAL
jgi:hypothetical protein